MLSDIFGAVFQWPVIVGAIAASVGYYILSTWEARKNLPPGPWPLPVVGNLLMFRGPGFIQDKLIKLAGKYGDPMSVWFGKILFVIMTKKETIREVLVNQQNNFCSRQDSVLIDLLLYGSQDIAMAKYGPIWKVHRKLAARSLRNIVGNSQLEDQVRQATEYVEKALLEKSEPLELHEYLSNSVFNVICSFAYGKMYDVDDEEFRRLSYLNRRGNEVFVKLMPLDFLPLTRYLPLEKMFSSVREAVCLVNELLGFLRGQIKDHRGSFEEGTTRDFVDAMIQEQKELAREGEEDLEKLTEDHLAWIVLDFFNAGTDTSAATLQWFFLHMITHPEYQEKCYQQIVENLGKERAARLDDRPNLTLIDACIFETLRLRTVAPLGMPHTPIHDAKLGPYIIPAGTVAMPNLYAMHLDEEGEFGENAKNYDPVSHFLEEDGESLKKPAGGFMPFGGGKRICLGEQLAKNVLFLTVTNLLQRLKFSKLPTGEYSDQPDPRYDAIMYAKPYKVLVEPR